LILDAKLRNKSRVYGNVGEGGYKKYLAGHV